MESYTTDSSELRSNHRRTRNSALFVQPFRVFILLTLLVTGAVFGRSPLPVHAEYRAALDSVRAVSQGVGSRAVVGSGGASMLDAPGGQPVRELSVGENLTALGRTADGLWLAVRMADDSTGWVATGDVLMFGVEQLPVIAGERIPAAGGPSGPVNLPTPTATSKPTLTPTPSPTPSATATPALSASSTLPVVSSPSSGHGAGQVAVVRSGGAMLADVPGGASIGTVPTGTAVTVSGRTADGAWLAAITPQGLRGWTSAASVVTFNAERLPVLATAVVGESQTESAAGADASPTAVAADPVSAIATPDSVGSVADASGRPATDLGISATVALTDSRLNVRSGPDVSFRIVAKAVPGEQFAALGRSEDSAWIQITGSQLGAGAGWVAEEFVSLSAPRSLLPVVEGGWPIDSTATGASARLSMPSPPASSPSSASGLAGNLVVQTSVGGDIYVIDLDSGGVRYLVTGFDPAISPDGETVAFTRDGGDHGLFLVDIDGANERRIYSGGEGLRAPTWSPDGQYVLFSRLSGEWECRDVGFGICLPDNPFLSSFDLTTRPEYGLSRVNRDGGDFRDLPALTSAKAPSWSLAGIAYQSNTGLEITQDEPEVTTQLLLSAPYYQDPDWQPDSDRVVFQSREGSHWEIFSVVQDGSGLFALTKPVTTLVDELPSNVAPAWSPDGQQIVYLSNRNESNDAGDWRLWVMDADGSNQRPLDIDLPFSYSFAAEQIVDWGVQPQ